MKEEKEEVEEKEEEEEIGKQIKKKHKKENFNLLILKDEENKNQINHYINTEKDNNKENCPIKEYEGKINNFNNNQYIQIPKIYNDIEIKKEKEKNIIIAQIKIEKENINKKIRIINSFEQSVRDHSLNYF